MKQAFNTKEYFNELALEVIQNFEKANKATTPVLVGTAKENEARRKLEYIFPSSVGVATGCIIDTTGHTSKQTDIVIYEKEICPVFSINDTPESTYFPCEGVIAVGEVKSTLNTKELTDCINKIESVKKSNRHIEDSLYWRKYCVNQGIMGAETQRFDQIKNEKDQIFGFVLCEHFGLKPETLIEKYVELVSSKQKHLVPNLIVSINDGIVVYIDKYSNNVRNSIIDATGVYFVDCPHGNFQFLLMKLDYILRAGRSVSEIPFYKYISKKTNLPGNGIYKKI